MFVMVPVVEARITLLSDLLQGRRLSTTGQYRPHIVFIVCTAVSAKVFCWE